MKSIAIFHGLGDCVNATTLIEPLKHKFPHQKLIWITSKRYLPLIENNPYIDESIGIPGDPWKADKSYSKLKQKYKGLITPAPYLNPPSSDHTLLGSFQERVVSITGKNQKLTPLLFMTQPEVQIAEDWLHKHHLKKFIMMETIFNSSQSFWDPSYTIMALKILADKGYSVLLAHRSDSKLKEYNKICPTYCMDLNFRFTPAIYNRSSGFIGISSGISCITHTHQCKKNLPHLEFVRGAHWSTKHYFKENKTISFKADPKHVRSLISGKFPKL